MHKSILKPDKSYTFSDYFELNYSTEDIVAEFGYHYQLAQLTLPQGTADYHLDKLQTMFYQKLPYFSLSSETAKREVFITPILFELLDYVKLKIDIEYSLYVNEQLKGTLDYLIRSAQELIVVEAKKADMEKGFSQLAVELIALDHYLDNDKPILYGAITVGEAWRFGTLDRQQKLISKDIDSFRVPADLFQLFKILMGILKPN